MALCIVSLSCGVCEADEAWIWNNAPSAEYINTDETNYGKITQNRDGTYYKLYRLDGRVADDFLFGYYSVKLHILTKLDSNEDIQVTAYKNDYYAYNGINIEWNYSGKIKKDM